MDNPKPAPKWGNGSLQDASHCPRGIRERTADTVGISPADANFSFSFVREILTPRGVTVIVVENEPSEALFKQTRYAREIGDGLWRVGLGRYDGSKWFPQIRHFFHVHTGHLPSAFDFIKSGLTGRGLLKCSKIGHADPELEIWRTFYPTASGGHVFLTPDLTR
jgi:hypothetical protein